MMYVMCSGAVITLDSMLIDSSIKMTDYLSFSFCLSVSCLSHLKCS